MKTKTIRRPGGSRERAAGQLPVNWFGIAAALIIAAVGVWVGGCQDGGGITDPLSRGGSAIVSDPVSIAPAAAPGRSSSLSATSATQFAFVSLPPGTIPAGETVIIRNPGTGTSVTSTVIAGGFDPVPVPASPGDTIGVTVWAGGSPIASFSYAVPPRLRPVMVRTDPASGKRDVALNASIVIVFSEPIDAATLTSTSVQLRRGTAVVAGRLEFRDPFHVTVAFVPAEPLAADATYQLVVTQAVADLNGERLEAPVDLTFTTTTQPAGPHLEFIVQPTSTTAGAVISPAIKVAIRDAGGNTITTATDSITVAIGDNPNGGTLSGTRRVAAVNGVATFADLSLDRGSDPDPSGYTLTASAAGFASATSASFRVAPGTAVALVFLHDPAKAITGLPMWPGLWANEVEVVDANGNQAYDFAGIVTLTIGTNPGAGSLSGTTVDTAFYGVASFQGLRISQPGSGYTLVVSAPGLRSDTTPPFDVGPPIGAAGNLILFASGGVSLVDLDNGGRATLRSTGFQPAWSPDGSRIAFSDYDGSNNQGIYVMNVDGSGVARLTSGALPAWSPDASKIAFGMNGGIYVMNPDGGGMRWLTLGIDPAWSPDGSKIAFESERDGNWEIYVMNADGSGVTRITNDTALDAHPAWSPDGTRIAFSSFRGGSWSNDLGPRFDLYVMNVDGSAVSRLDTGLVGSAQPTWSPDGTRIAFAAYLDPYPYQVYVINADGSGLTPPLTMYEPRPGAFSMGYGGEPAWRP